MLQLKKLSHWSLAISQNFGNIISMIFEHHLANFTRIYTYAATKSVLKWGVSLCGTYTINNINQYFTTTTTN
ncbi:hypothetical protein F993_02802 [Acinetobacter proteolyticus]|uniref:Uncharacterized protein n=1 Tax=Acinetobacter proteolyticus TaxID=1776741 RepID=A0ABN0JCL7_9GAMM|nr:hypothetical protein F993_02802 [Acinetobacter proteolyticus]ESK41735.1 hypothetical protein F987_02480 [Acinetobacter gyllenbergii NIPH 230]